MKKGQTGSRWVGGHPKQEPLNQASSFQTTRLRHYRGLAHLGERSLQQLVAQYIQAVSGSQQSLQAPCRHQGSSGGTTKGGQANRTKKCGQLSYVQAAQEGLGTTNICNGYPKVQIFKETVINIQQVIGGLWMSSLRSSPPGSLIPTGLKELPMFYARTKRPRTGYTAKYWR